MDYGPAMCAILLEPAVGPCFGRDTRPGNRLHEKTMVYQFQHQGSRPESGLGRPAGASGRAWGGVSRQVGFNALLCAAPPPTHSYRLDTGYWYDATTCQKEKDDTCMLEKKTI